MGYKTGEGRTQSALFPVILDELVPKEAIVRVINAWVDSLGSAAVGVRQGTAGRTVTPGGRAVLAYKRAANLKGAAWMMEAARA